MQVCAVPEARASGPCLRPVPLGLCASYVQGMDSGAGEWDGMGRSRGLNDTHHPLWTLARCSWRTERLQYICLTRGAQLHFRSCVRSRLTSSLRSCR